MSDRRVVVTGVGMMTPVGVGRDASWEGLLNFKNGIAETTLVEVEDLPSKVSGEVSGFEVTDWLDPQRGAPHGPLHPTSPSPPRPRRSSSPVSTSPPTQRWSAA